MEYFLFLFLSAVTIFLRLSGSLVYFCWLLLAVMWSEWFSVRRICLGNFHVETLDGPYLMRAPLEGTCLCAWRPPWALLTHDHLKTKPWVWVFIGFVTRIARRSCGTQRLYVFLPLVQRKAGLWPLNFISGKKKSPLLSTQTQGQTCPLSHTLSFPGDRFLPSRFLFVFYKFPRLAAPIYDHQEQERVLLQFWVPDIWHPLGKAMFPWGDTPPSFLSSDDPISFTYDIAASF